MASAVVPMAPRGPRWALAAAYALTQPSQELLPRPAKTCPSQALGRSWQPPRGLGDDHQGLTVASTRRVMLSGFWRGGNGWPGSRCSSKRCRGWPAITSRSLTPKLNLPTLEVGLVTQSPN